MALSVGSVLIWIVAFFGLTAPMQWLGGDLDVSHAWRWLTYPLANPVAPRDFVWLALGAWCFTLFAGPLERMWGSLRFCRVFVVLTLFSALMEWFAYGAVTHQLPPAAAAVWSLRIPAAAIFTIWAALNKDVTVLAMFVIPVQARYLALVGGILMFFDDRGPFFGLAAVIVMTCSWFWALRYGSAYASARSQSISPSSWFKERQRAQRKSRFQVLEGGTAAAPIKSGPRSLESIKPAPRVDSGAEKELDRILDKIRFEGMGALTDAERQTLDSQSRRLRDEP